MKDILLAEIIDMSAGLATDKAIITASLIILGISWIFFGMSILMDHWHNISASNICCYVWMILCFGSLIVLTVTAACYLVGSFKLDQMILSYENIYGPLPGGII